MCSHGMLFKSKCKDCMSMADALPRNRWYLVSLSKWWLFANLDYARELFSKYFDKNTPSQAQQRPEGAARGGARGILSTFCLKTDPFFQNIWKKAHSCFRTKSALSFFANNHHLIRDARYPATGLLTLRRSLCPPTLCLAAWLDPPKQIPHITTDWGLSQDVGNLVFTIEYWILYDSVRYHGFFVVWWTLVFACPHTPMPPPYTPPHFPMLPPSAPASFAVVFRMMTSLIFQYVF